MHIVFFKIVTNQNRIFCENAILRKCQMTTQPSLEDTQCFGGSRSAQDICIRFDGEGPDGPQKTTRGPLWLRSTSCQRPAAALCRTGRAAAAGRQRGTLFLPGGGQNSAHIWLLDVVWGGGRGTTFSLLSCVLFCSVEWWVHVDCMYSPPVVKKF